MSISDYQNSFEINPIILVGGVTGAGMVPLGTILNARMYPTGLLSSSVAAPATDFFGSFKILPGHTLMDNQVATYPFANQTTAANAVITQPLKLSLEMVAPADSVMTTSIKRATFGALKTLLDNHTAQGGWYNVSTPTYVYQGCLLTSIIDSSAEMDGSQVQTRWIWNFMQPLLTAEAAQAAQNQSMSKLSNQTINPGDPPGANSIQTSYNQPSANTIQNFVPSATQPLGSNIASTGSPTATPSINSLGSNTLQF